MMKRPAKVEARIVSMTARMAGHNRAYQVSCYRPIIAIVLYTWYSLWSLASMIARMAILWPEWLAGMWGKIKITGQSCAVSAVYKYPNW